MKLPESKSPEFPQAPIPGKTIIFIGLPLKYENSFSKLTGKFFQKLEKVNDDPNAAEYYVRVDVTGVNPVYATCELAAHFDSYRPAEWFLLWADDLVSTPQDIHCLVQTANNLKADVISGLCVVKMSGRDQHNRKRWALCGNFIDEVGTVQLPHRGVFLTDMDVSTGVVRKYDFVGGGCALFHRRVIEALRPKDNGGLGYFCHDLQTPAYDLRVFQRIKEKGFTVMQHCGVVFGHVGAVNYKKPDGTVEAVEYPFTYWDLPSYREVGETVEQKTEDVTCIMI